MLKRLFCFLFVISTLMCSVLATPVYADNNLTNGGGGNATGGGGNIEVEANSFEATPEDADAMKNNLANIFSPDIWSGTNIAAGTQFAAPFVKVTMIFAVAIVTIIAFLFFGVTALDLAYITVPIVRPLLMKGKDSMQDKGASKFCCISDSAIEAVNGAKSGGMGGGGDRGVGSCLTKYISSRTVEFTAFVVFCMLFFTGMLGNIVVAIFNIMYSIIQAVMNIAGAQ